MSDHPVEEASPPEVREFMKACKPARLSSARAMHAGMAIRFDSTLLRMTARMLLSPAPDVNKLSVPDSNLPLTVEIIETALTCFFHLLTRKAAGKQIIARREI
jgi:hypothetical protein